MRLITLAFLLTISSLVFCQTSGYFGGNAGASGYSSASNTYGKWLKVATMGTNGSWSRASLMIDFFPKLSSHGDARQTLIVNMGNGSTGIHASSNDIAIITHYGINKTILDAKVVHTSGTGVSNNEFSVWVKLGSSHIYSIPIEIRARGNVNAFSTNQPYYTSIQDAGTTFDVQSKHGKYGGTYLISSENSGEAVLKIEADRDNNNEDDNASMQMMQDGGSLGAFIGFNKSWGGGSSAQGLEADNLFRIGTRYGGNDSFDRFVINGKTGDVGIGTTTPDEKLTVNGTIHSKEVRVDLDVPAPDYVFESDYELRTLKETEQYINNNKHLPEIPSAKEMEINGVELGEMNMLLLKKIEELTLYQIELLKRIEKLENEQEK